jgi:hypothetical protein
LTVHLENNAHFAMASTAIREIEVCARLRVHVCVRCGPLAPPPGLATGEVSLGDRLTHYCVTLYTQVSHWGNVAFEEFLEVHNAGAKLKGGFARVEYMVRPLV